MMQPLLLMQCLGASWWPPGLQTFYQNKTNTKTQVTFVGVKSISCHFQTFVLETKNIYIYYVLYLIVLIVYVTLRD